MHHFIVVNVNIDEVGGHAQLLDLQGLACVRHIPLLDAIQILKELKFMCGCVDREKLLEVPPCLLQCLGLSDITETVIVNT